MLYAPQSPLLTVVPRDWARQERILPLAVQEGELTVACWQPLTAEQHHELRALTCSRISTRLFAETDWPYFAEAYAHQSSKLNGAYGSSSLAESSGSLISARVEPSVHSPSEDVNDTATLARAIIENAAQRQASDIHLEASKEHLSVRVRVDGLLQPMTKLSMEQGEELLAHLKLRSHMDVAQKHAAQDGHLELVTERGPLNLRVATMPVLRGEKMVMRFLYQNIIEYNLKDLGFAPHFSQRLKHLLSQPHGLILIAGPTGSGKTTTLYAALHHLHNIARNITSIEDPIEYELSGINQIAVQPARGMTFAQGLRGILRQDPDVVMVGEIRDAETASIALSAAITGRLVLSSIHTNDACAAVLRLIDMGVAPYMVAAALIGIVGQRLVRTVCPHCRDTIDGRDGHQRVQHSEKGCRHCNNQGYRGRSGVFEMVEMSEALRHIVTQHPTLDQLRDQAARDGWEPLKHDGKRLLREGRTDEAEIRRVLVGDSSL